MRHFLIAFFAVITMPALAEEAPPQPLTCAGTEPFWSFRLSGDMTALSTPDGPDIPLPISQYRAAQNRNGEWSVSLGEAIAVIRQETCSDGMSDNDYPYSVTLVTRERTLSGCCRPEEP
ncbi:MAG: hypothetical protein HXY22_10395 [Alphaproteobacteria bacterium]|nr:hypothetical protein [Alphaproteobacteria bacterium]